MLFSNGDRHMSIKSWEVSDAFWEIVEPLIPRPKRDDEKQYKRKVGGGRKPIEARTVFSAIVYVLRTGIQWKALPKEVLAVRVQFIGISENGSSRASFWNFGSVAYPSMMTWKESPGNGNP